MKEKDPGKMLSEARNGLTKCRELFILSTLMLMVGPTARESQAFWINTWFNASLEEKKITQELVAPAKLKTGAFRTVPAVENRVRRGASDFTKEISTLKGRDASGLARAIVDPHIKFTKKIQKEMGVPEYIVYSEETIARKEHAIPICTPALRKATR